MPLDKAAKREGEIQVLFCKGALELGVLLCCCVPWGAAVEQSDSVQPPASIAVQGLLASKPSGTAFSSAYFLSKLNCNCGLRMDGITYICLLTFITICRFSRRESLFLAVAWMFILGQVRPLQ